MTPLPIHLHLVKAGSNALAVPEMATHRDELAMRTLHCRRRRRLYL